jgi:hypothetical protein
MIESTRRRLRSFTTENKTKSNFGKELLFSIMRRQTGKQKITEEKKKTKEGEKQDVDYPFQ